MSFQIYVGMTIVCRPRFMVGTAIVRSFHTYLSEDHTITKLQSEVEETDLQNGKNLCPRYINIFTVCTVTIQKISIKVIIIR